MHPDEILSKDITGTKYDYSFYIDGCGRITCDIKPLIYSMIAAGKTIAIHDHAQFDSPYDEAGSCWIEKNVSYKSITEQMDFYVQEGLPRLTGYYETPVLIRKFGDQELTSIMTTWWQQIERFTHRDQLSLPYALWKNGKDSSYVFSLGNNVFKSPYFIFYPGHNMSRY